jgi:hypothetical protein
MIDLSRTDILTSVQLHCLVKSADGMHLNIYSDTTGTRTSTVAASELFSSIFALAVTAGTRDCGTSHGALDLHFGQYFNCYILKIKPSMVSTVWLVYPSGKDAGS